MVTRVAVLFLKTLAAAGLGGSALAAAAQPVTWTMPPDAVAWADRHDARLRLFLKQLYAEGERNAVLNFKQLGLAAMQIGNFQLAAKSFDAAIERVETVYSDSESAAKAKSLWAAEKVKDFKGDPYERSMLFYYRGLVYLYQGEWDNASASFKAADFQSTVAEEGKQRSDFGLMNYLAAFTSACDGGSKAAAADLFKLASGNDSLIAAVPNDFKTIALIESGAGPVKYTSSPRNALRVMPNATKVSEAVNVPGLTAAVPAADLTYQASTRGGRVFDSIIAGKVEFKSGAEDVAKGALAFSSGAAQMSSHLSQAYTNAGLDGRQAGAAGAALAAAGLLASIVSNAVASSVEDAADVRHWTNLPGGIFIAGAVSTAPVSSFIFKGRRRDREEPFILNVTRNDCRLAWGRTHSALSAADNGTAELALHPAIVEGSRAELNKVFRLQLMSNFQ